MTATTPPARLGSRLLAAALAALVVPLALPGCGRGADSGATANPNAPGRPGTGNGTEFIRPQAESLPESPQVGGTLAQVPIGVSGDGTLNRTDTGAPGAHREPASALAAASAANEATAAAATGPTSGGAVDRH